MKRWKICYCGGLILTAGFAARAGAQAVPAAPAAAGAAAVPAVPAAAAPAAAPAAPANIWTFLCLSPEQKAACKTKFCNSALGQMLNNGLKPIGAISGGLVGNCCPSLNVADLNKPPDSAEGAAARIKADEAAAKARREAVRFLGTVDCRYWPEAQDALINALRADRNECVRLEAAVALGHGCCCNKATIKALMLTVSGSAEDGNPPERSDRVRAWAYAALAHCLACFCETEEAPPPEIKKEGAEPPPPGPEPAPRPGIPEQLPTPMSRTNPVDYYRRAASAKREPLIEQARQLLERRTPFALPVASPMTGRSLADIVSYAIGNTSPTATAFPEVVEKPSSEKTVVEKSLLEKPGMAKPVVEKPGTEKRIMPVSGNERPALLSPPVWRNSTGQVSPPTPVSSSKPATLAPPVAYPPTPSPVMPVLHREAPAVAPTAAVSAPRLAMPEPPSATQPQGAPVAVAYMSVLQGSNSVEQREWAAENLSEFDGGTNPRIVDALTRAARHDDAPVVRIACLRSLARMKMQSLPVLTAVRESLKDGDPRVRSEAEQTLRQLSAEKNSGPGVTQP